MLHHNYGYFTQLFNPRTGSHMMRACLEKHPFLDSSFIFENWPEKQNTEYLIAIGADSLHIRESDRMIGIRVNCHTVAVSGRYDLLEEKVIVNYRKNKLDEAISWYLAHANGFIHEKYKGDIEIDLDKCLKVIEGWGRYEREIADTIDALWIEYHELTDGDGLQQVQEYLGVPVMNLKPNIEKQSTKPLIDYVRNKDELLNSDLSKWYNEP